MVEIIICILLFIFTLFWLCYKFKNKFETYEHVSVLDYVCIPTSIAQKVWQLSLGQCTGKFIINSLRVHNTKCGLSQIISRAANLIALT